jgi:hypothetical protein
MATAMPREGIYFRKGHFDDRLIDELITVKVSVVVVTPLGAEEKELTFSGSDILSAIQAMLTVVTGLGGVLGLETAQVFGGTLPSPAQQRALAARSSALAEPA